MDNVLVSIERGIVVAVFRVVLKGELGGREPEKSVRLIDKRGIYNATNKSI